MLCLRRGTPGSVAARVPELIDRDRAATAGPVVLEVLGGARDDSELERLREDFDALHWCEITTATWFVAARDANDLRRKGIAVPFTDVLIARAALDTDCTVLHRDKHFETIAKVTGVKTETV